MIIDNPEYLNYKAILRNLTILLGDVNNYSEIPPIVHLIEIISSAFCFLKERFPSAVVTKNKEEISIYWEHPDIIAGVYLKLIRETGKIEIKHRELRVIYNTGIRGYKTWGDALADSLLWLRYLKQEEISDEKL
jgi:hypothetical protein